MSDRGSYLWIAKRNPRKHTLITGAGNLVIPGVTDRNELRDLVQAHLTKHGLTWTDWDKYLEQAEIDHEYRVKLEAARRELRRRLEGQVRTKVDKFIPRRVI